ncbi:MAG: ATP-binding protein, partial [Firmicutes bacterium]|nr:ATP-binding protein [Bacillota bacterium]
MGDITNTKYNFNISLSVLNHLGRNLYRNIITVIGEAISNSWDADAENVWIEINRDEKWMSIKDDGIGMSENDFQNKFLKIGYSKRKNQVYKSNKGRPFIGRKGIGKLALLSCAARVHIVTKTENSSIVGGIIDNSGLDKAITDDLNSQEYILENLGLKEQRCLSEQDSGTYIFFEDINNGIFNTLEYIKKAVALYFRFAVIDEKFNIYVNQEKIDESKLQELADNTQFLWKINKFKDGLIGIMNDNVDAIKNISSNLKMNGYIATVKKPSNLKIRNTQEKVTLDLFVNGRLREKDILRHFPTSRIVENYLYGQIHFDELDEGDSKDIFTSSRESVLSDDPNFLNMLKEVERIVKGIIEEWDILRRKHGDDGDSDNKAISKKQRKAQELFNATLQEMKLPTNKDFIKKGGKVEEWV